MLDIQPQLLAGVIFFLGVVIIWRLPKYKWIAAVVLLILITPIATPGFWFSEGELGINDWDFYFTVHTTVRNTLLQYHQFPQWNPWICGGTAGIGDPEFRFFTPTFITQLILGVPTGFRVATWIATAFGAIGILMLSKRLKLSVYAALVAAIGVAFSSVNILEIVEGHPNIFAAMYIPWIFWAWLAIYQGEKIRKKKLWPLTCGVFLALTFFQGGIYLLMYVVIAFIGLLVLVKRPKAAFIASLQAGLWGLGFAAVKLVPVLLWLVQFQDENYVASTNILPYLDKILLGRILHGSREIIPDQVSGWHEYGAYIGPFILALSAIGVWFHRKNRIVKGLLIATAASILLASSGQALKPFFDQVSFIPRSNISRFMLFAIIPLSLLAGFGLDTIIKLLTKWLPEKSAIVKLSHIIPLIIIGIVAVDLMSLTHQLSQQAFVVPRHVPEIELPEPDPIAYTASTYDAIYSASIEDRRKGINETYTRAYEATLKGYGTLNYCTPLTPKRAVRTIHDEGGAPLMDLGVTETGEKGSFTLQEWTPNRIKVHVILPEDNTIFLNTNYAKGWMVNGNPAREAGDRVATNLPAGEHNLVFEYKTPGLVPGIVISIITVIVAGIMISVRKTKT